MAAAACPVTDQWRLSYLDILCSDAFFTTSQALQILKTFAYPGEQPQRHWHLSSGLFISSKLLSSCSINHQCNMMIQPPPGSSHGLQPMQNAVQRHFTSLLCPGLYRSKVLGQELVTTFQQVRAFDRHPQLIISVLLLSLSGLLGLHGTSTSKGLPVLRKAASCLAMAIEL